MADRKLLGATSGYPRKAEQGTFLEEDVLLQKPFTADDLLELVSASLAKS